MDCQPNVPVGDIETPTTDGAESDHERRLLDALRDNPEAAAAPLNPVRIKIMNFLRRQGCREPDDCWAETLIRLIGIAREKMIDNPESYVRGVARNVHREHLRRSAPYTQLSPEVDPPVSPPPMPDHLVRQHLQACWAHASPEDRALLKRAAVTRRSTLALVLGVHRKTVWQRIRDARKRLEECLRLRGVVIDRFGNA